MKYVLGVDGGNTKTQYCLYTTSGEYVDCLRTGTCSHERFADGFVGCKRALDEQLGMILGRNKLKSSDLAYSVFGLAGADFEWQKIELSKIIASLGFSNFVVDNDGYIALKAGSADGAGVCSINGTGTVTVGINKSKRLQVGGIGDISGDKGGGTYLSRSAAAAVYDTCFRCGADTVLKYMIFNGFGIACKDDYAEAIIKILASSDNMLKINRMISDAEKQGDKVTVNILGGIGEELGLTSAGCLRELQHSGTVNIVLAGSVWVKGGYTAMLKAYKTVLTQNCLPDTKLSYTVLKQEPAIGAVIWALERAGVITEAMREKLLG